MKKAVCLAVLAIFTITITYAQTSFTLIPDSSKVTVYGTSSMHDWETSSTKTNGEAMIEMADDSLLSISGLKIQFPTDSFDSGKRVMDKKTRGALKDKKHPEIYFELTEINEIYDDSLMATGTFFAAGTEVERRVTVYYTIHEDGSMRFWGRSPFKMTDFGVDPPTALLGSLKTGDEIEIGYNVLFNAKS